MESSVGNIAEASAGPQFLQVGTAHEGFLREWSALSQEARDVRTLPDFGDWSAGKVNESKEFALSQA